MSSPHRSAFADFRAGVVAQALRDLGRPWWPFPIDLARGLLVLERDKRPLVEICDDALCSMFAALEMSVLNPPHSVWEWLYGDWLQKLNIEITRRGALGWGGPT